MRSRLLQVKPSIASEPKEKVRTPIVTLKLYIAGQTPRSNRAIENLREICERLLPGGHEIRIIDVLSHPQEAEEDRVLATPTLIKVAPGQSVRVIGDLSETDIVLKALDLECQPSHSKLR
jgi:circadian clock protein KaiB